MATKISLKGYFEPTPSLFRKIGDSLLSVSAYLLLNPELLGEEYTRTVSAVFIFAKFLTNFFTEVPNTDSNDTETTVR